MAIRNIGRLRAGGNWTPAALFAVGVAGAWYDPSDLSSMWQDSAGTTAAAVNSPVGKILDKSGNGNHATQGTAAARPILRQSGSLYYLEFDGVDDCLSASIASTDARNSYLGQSGSYVTFAAFKTMLAMANTSSGVQRVHAGYTLSGPSDCGFTQTDTGVNTIINSGLSDTNAHLRAWNSTATGSAFRADSTTTTGAAIASAVTVNAISMGAKFAGSTAPVDYGNVRIYQAVALFGGATAAQEAQLATYLGAKGGLTL